MINHKAVARILRKRNLQVRPLRRFVRTTDSDHDHPVFPNLAADFTPTAANQLWVADLTYMAIAVGFVYVAVILDAWSRRVVGYAIARRIDTRLTLAALHDCGVQRRQGQHAIARWWPDIPVPRYVARHSGARTPGRIDYCYPAQRRSSGQCARGLYRRDPRSTRTSLQYRSQARPRPEFVSNHPRLESRSSARSTARRRRGRRVKSSRPPEQCRVSSLIAIEPVGASASIREARFGV